MFHHSGEQELVISQAMHDTHTAHAGLDAQRVISLGQTEVNTLLDISAALKAALREPGVVYSPMAGRGMVTIFQKRSTRTRLSTELGVSRLGGHAVFLSPADIHLGVAETLRDTAVVAAGYADVTLARVGPHADVCELAAHSPKPVINALSDTHHPLQLLADMLTLREHFGRLQGLRLAWVGDGNNILHGLLASAAAAHVHVRAATPKGYAPRREVVDASMRSVKETGAGSILLTHDPAEAVAGADAVITDTWVSMGQEKEAAERKAAFTGYRVTESMAAGAAKHWVFLHCLPRKQEEVDDAVFYSQRSLVWSEAENRMWTLMAVVLAQLHKEVYVPVRR